MGHARAAGVVHLRILYSCSSQWPSPPVSAHHRWAPNILNAVSFAGTLFVVWDVMELAVWPTLFGAALVYAGKLWFLDCMA